MKIKSNFFIALGVVVLIVALGFFFSYMGNNKKVMEEKKMMTEKASSLNSMKNGYSGNLLAGTEDSPYLDFNKLDYDRASSKNKTILLYFYANWCSLCALEQPKTFSAFNALNSTHIIGFRVNYKDSDTDPDEVQLAKYFGVSYQHTKVIIQNGKMVLKAPDSWDFKRYMDELRKFS